MKTAACTRATILPNARNSLLMRDAVKHSISSYEQTLKCGSSSPIFKCSTRRSISSEMIRRVSVCTFALLSSLSHSITIVLSCLLSAPQAGNFFTMIDQALGISKSPPTLAPPSRPHRLPSSTSFSHLTCKSSPILSLLLQIWHRAEGDSPVHGFKISATIRAPAQALLALISEVDLYSTLFPFLSKSLQVQRLGRARRVANVVLKGTVSITPFKETTAALYGALSCALS